MDKIEDYSILIRLGSGKPTGRYEITRIGTRREIIEYQETYRTKAGDFSPEEWRKKVKSLVKETNQEELLSKIISYCRENCVWLKKEKDLEEYALNILAGKVYLHWKDFPNK